MIRPLYEAILGGDMKAALAETQKALSAQAQPAALVQETMVPAMDEVGRRFEAGDYFVPEMMISARAMKACLEAIRPQLAASGAQPAGRVVIGTVKGDLHDIGKNIVSSMLEGGGFEVADLGVDVPPEKFVAAVQEKSPDLVCLSALLTVTMPAMKTTLEALSQAGLRGRVKVLVGGAPVTRQFAEQIGADGYGENAAAAVGLARQLLPKA